MRRTVHILILSSLFLSMTYARDGFYSAVKGDSVFIFLTETPAVGSGMLVERKGPSDESYSLLTEEPILPVLSASEAQKILGTDYETVAHALDAENIQQTLFRLRNDPFRGGIFTMINQKVGHILGRFFAAGGHQKNKNYTYRIRIVNRSGKTLETYEKTIPIIEKLPDPPTDLEANLQPSGVILKWNYPDWQPGTEDITVQFYLFRRINNDPFQRAGNITLLRLNISLLFLDTDLTPGDSICYYLTAVDAAGLQSLPSAKTCITFKDIVPPASPEGLITRVKEKSIELIWNMSPELDVSHYNVYRAPNMSAENIKINVDPVPVDNPFFVDKNCIEGNQYFYSVSAVDSFYNESKPCNRMDAWIVDQHPPASPDSLSANVKNRTVTLIWSSPSDKDLRGFYVLRGFNSDNLYRQNDHLLSENRFIDSGVKNTGLQPGKKYYYCVESVDSVFNKSKPSGIWVSIPDDQPPNNPGDVRVSNIHGHSMSIEWDPSPSLDVASYQIVRYSDHDSLLFSVSLPNELLLKDTSVVKGISYQYAVTALDSAGNQSQSVQSAVTLMKDFTPPHSPRFVQAILSEDGVHIHWEQCTASDLLGYHVYCSDIKTGIFNRINNQVITELSFIDKNGTSGKYYKIRSVDTSGNESQYSMAATALMGE